MEMDKKNGKVPLGDPNNAQKGDRRNVIRSGLWLWAVGSTKITVTSYRGKHFEATTNDDERRLELDLVMKRDGRPNKCKEN